jgi:hypothetical protein
MPVVRVPLPCVVYTRRVPGGVYTYSHHCDQTALKCLPASMRTSDLREHDPQQNLAALHKTCFLVLVAGDVARCVSVAAVERKQKPQPFLFLGSSYARDLAKTPLDGMHSELNEDYVSLHFHGTMAVFDKAARFTAVIPLESGISLFPRQIRESDAPLLARWVSACMLRSVQSSVWVTESGDSYNEHTMEWSPRLKSRV